MAATYPVETIAQLLDLTPRRVQQLSAEGVIPKAERGRYELVPAVKGYVRFLKERAINADVSGDQTTEHKRRLMKARADIAEFEAQRLAGELVPVDQVEKVWTEIVSRFRQRALAVSPKAAPLTAVDPTTEGCAEIIETYINEALAELASTDVVAVTVDESRASGVRDGGATAETDDLAMG